MSADKKTHVRRNAAFLGIMGFIVASFGVIAMLVPFVAGLNASIVLGLLIGGRSAMQLYYGLKVRHWGHLVGPYMGMGSLMMSHVSVATATLLLIQPLTMLPYSRLVVAGYLFLLGLTDVLHAFELRPVTGWWTMAMAGVSGFLFSGMVWLQWPIGGNVLYGITVGSSFVVGGSSLVTLAWLSDSVDRETV